MSLERSLTGALARPFLQWSGFLQRKRNASSAELEFFDVEVDLALLAFKGYFLIVCLSSIGQIGCGILLAWRYQDPWIWKMVYGMSVIAAARLIFIAAFNLQKQTLTPASAYWWQNIYGASTLPWYGCSTVVTFYTFRCHYVTGQGICTIGVLASCAAMGAAMGVRPWASYASGLMMLGGLGVCIAQSPDKLFACYSVFLIILFAITHCRSVSGKFDIVVKQLRGQHKLKLIAEIDMLTGLANRRSFQKHLASLCDQPGAFAVLFLDLDRFKQVNDAHGHAMGDELLIQVALRLLNEVRSSDRVARLGGDEFAILQTPEASADSAEALAIRLNRCIGQPFFLQEIEVSIGVSIGIKLCPESRRDPKQVLNEADDALYQVKHSGRGGFCFAPGNIAARSTEDTSEVLYEVIL